MKYERGFVALMSVVIISAIMTVFIYLLATSTFLARFDALDTEDKRVSLSLAEACVNSAILQVAQGNTAPAQVTVEAGKTCRICSVIAATGVIQTRAVYNHAYTNLSVTVDTGTYAVTTWSEPAMYSGPSCTLP